MEIKVIQQSGSIPVMKNRFTCIKGNTQIYKSIEKCVPKDGKLMNILNILQNFALKGKCKHPLLKIEADFSADPIWCNVCSYNLDIDDFPLSEELKEELFNWVHNYKKIPMNEHNKIGIALTEKVKGEIGRDYPIIFIAQ